MKEMLTNLIKEIQAEKSEFLTKKGKLSADLQNVEAELTGKREGISSAELLENSKKLLGKSDMIKADLRETDTIIATLSRRESDVYSQLRKLEQAEDIDEYKAKLSVLMSAVEKFNNKVTELNQIRASAVNAWHEVYQAYGKIPNGGWSKNENGVNERMPGLPKFNLELRDIPQADITGIKM